MPPEGLPNCPSLSRSDRKRNEVASFFGSTRRGALFCRSGNWLEIIDERTSQLEARRGGIGDTVRGTRHEGSRFSILEFLSVAIGLVSIRGEFAQRYLCMDRDGKLYAAAPNNYTSECVFLEEMMENYYNLYSSCAYGTRRRPWYVALRRTGRSRRGKNARRRRKASHFLVVHYDTPPPTNPGQYDLGSDLNAFYKFKKT
ncbi:fibroblast growth factor [Dictyocaulus viviparus]|uniref:Fibroblast growth factor n=1 Tax=Dictyocaulus viviparus TaxID=29172 RepID=A0A0D8XG94_DICVI|nr:fibroblast growth factor [Dictyocaulus viviparus]